MSGKSAALKQAQSEIKRLEKLKQEVLGRMPEKTNLETKPLVDLLKIQLANSDRDLKAAKKILEESTSPSDLVDMEVLKKAKEGTEGKTKVWDQTKDLAKEKIEAIIDEHISNKDTAKEVKKAVDENIDLAEKVIKEKVEDIIDDLLVKLRAKVKEALVNGLVKKISALALKAIDKVSKEPGGEGLVGELLSNVIKRIEKEAPGIIEYELQRLFSKDGLKALLDIAVNVATEVWDANPEDREFTAILKSVFQKIVKNPVFKEIFKGLKRRLLRKFIQIVEEELENTYGPIIDLYLRQYGNWKGSLLNTGKRGINIGPFWGCVSIALSFQANLSANLSSKRHKLGITAKGSINGKASAGIGVVLGFDVPVIGAVKIEGGVQGGPELVGTAAISFKIENAILKGKMEAATLDIDMSARLYLETGIPNDILSYVPEYISGVTVSGSTLYYPLGRIKALTCRTPSYQLTFDITKGKYSYTGAVGKYTMSVHPKVKAYLKETKEAIEAAAQAALDAVNPTTWDLNPFDDKGWIGSWFD